MAFMTEPTAPSNSPAASSHLDAAREAIDADRRHAVHCEVDQFGQGVLTVDGHDLTERVARGGVTIQSGDREVPTRVYVQLMGGVTYDGPAEVTVLQGVPTVQFLEGVNPDELEKAALARRINANPIQMALEVLIEMAQATEIDIGSANEDRAQEASG